MLISNKISSYQLFHKEIIMHVWSNSKCLCIGAKLYLGSKLIKNVIVINYNLSITSMNQLHRDIVFMTQTLFLFLFYNETYLCSLQMNNMEELSGYDLSIRKRFRTFFVYIDWWINILFKRCLICKSKWNFIFLVSITSNSFIKQLIFLMNL